MNRGSKPRILLVEDSPALARVYMDYLQQEPCSVTLVETGEAALDKLDSETFDAVLLDLKLPDMNGMDILRSVTSRELATAVIIISAHGTVGTAVDALQNGAKDFLEKPFTAERLIVTLRNVLDYQRLTSLVDSFADLQRSGYCGFIGSSLAMQAVYRMIDSAAPSNAPVFITGESGTGKELCARAIHDQSPRHAGPFIALNSAAIPRGLMESEIFGHVRGSFSGAVANRDGAATQADGGTLFLDEICDMDIELQSKLLRFLQSETFQRVGGTRLEEVDIRFVCATNRNPMEEVRAGRFREDLYYRLHVIPINLPPLRQRDDDVLMLAEHYLIEYAAQESKNFARLSGAVRAVFLSYDWPGNVRELQNVIRQVVVLNEGDEVGVEMLPPELTARLSSAPARAEAAKAPGEPATATNPENLEELARLVRPLDEIEREAIEGAIRLSGGKVRIAATLLGISHATLYRKINAWKSEEG